MPFLVLNHHGGQRVKNALQPQAEQKQDEIEPAAEEQTLVGSYHDSLARGYAGLDDLATLSELPDVLREQVNTPNLRSQLSGASTPIIGLAVALWGVLATAFAMGYYAIYTKAKIKREYNNSLPKMFSSLTQELEHLDDAQISDWLRRQNAILAEIAQKSGRFSALELAINDQHLGIRYEESEAPPPQAQPTHSYWKKLNDFVGTTTLTLVSPALVFWPLYQFLTLLANPGIAKSFTIYAPPLLLATYILRVLIDLVNRHHPSALPYWKKFYDTFFYEPVLKPSNSALEGFSAECVTAILRFVGSFSFIFYLLFAICVDHPEENPAYQRVPNQTPAAMVSPKTESHLRGAFREWAVVQQLGSHTETEEANDNKLAENKQEQTPHHPRKTLRQLFPKLGNNKLRTVFYFIRFMVENIILISFLGWFILHHLEGFGIKLPSTVTISSPLFIATIVLFGLITLAAFIKTREYSQRLDNEYRALEHNVESFNSNPESEAFYQKEEKLVALKKSYPKHADKVDHRRLVDDISAVFKPTSWKDKIFSVETLTLLGAFLYGILIFRTLALEDTINHLPYVASTVGSFGKFLSTSFHLATISTKTAGGVLLGLAALTGVVYMLISKYTNDRDDAVLNAGRLMTTDKYVMLRLLDTELNAYQAVADEQPKRRPWAGIFDREIKEDRSSLAVLDGMAPAVPATPPGL